MCHFPVLLSGGLVHKMKCRTVTSSHLNIFPSWHMPKKILLYRQSSLVTTPPNTILFALPCSVLLTWAWVESVSFLIPRNTQFPSWLSVTVPAALPPLSTRLFTKASFRLVPFLSFPLQPGFLKGLCHLFVAPQPPVIWLLHSSC